MSHTSNTELLELAAEHIDYWSGEGYGKLIEQAVQENDLERLAEYLKESAYEIFKQDFRPDPPSRSAEQALEDSSFICMNCGQSNNYFRWECEQCSVETAKQDDGHGQA